MKQTHTHHIIPKHAGGTDDPANLVELTLVEHTEAHRQLWESQGRLEDKMAWLMLSGKTEEGEQVRRELAGARLKALWETNREMMLRACSNPMTDERKQHISIATQAAMKSEMIREKIRTARARQVITEETKAKLRGPRPSACHPKTHTENMGRYPRTKKTIEQMRQNRTGKGCGDRNAMSNPENRAKVGASKVGRKLYIGPNGERKMFIPSTAPEGFYVSS